MTKYINCVFVKHDNNDKSFLFCIETLDKVCKGQRVMCNTMYGESEGVCTSDNFMLDERALKNIANVVGAYLPLRPVIGIVEIAPTVTHILRPFCNSASYDEDLPF